MLSPLPVTLDGQSLRPADVVAVARYGERVTLGPQAKTRLQQARHLVDRLVAEDRVVYGLTTGVGALKNVRIPPGDTRQLQRNLSMSHEVGIAPPPANPGPGQPLPPGDLGSQPSGRRAAGGPAEPRHLSLGAGKGVAGGQRRSRPLGARPPRADRGGRR